MRRDRTTKWEFKRDTYFFYISVALVLVIAVINVVGDIAAHS